MAMTTAALERCAAVRFALIDRPLTRAEIRAATGMSANDLKPAMIRCVNAHMIYMLPKRLSAFGRRVVARDAEAKTATNQKGTP